MVKEVIVPAGKKITDIKGNSLQLFVFIELRKEKQNFRGYTFLAGLMIGHKKSRIRKECGLIRQLLGFTNRLSVERRAVP